MSETIDADALERIFHAALSKGDIESVGHVLTVMAVDHPYRAQSLMDNCRVALAALDGRESREAGA